ncbi:MAG: hypothetical protein EAZ64_06995 [Sphingobacteriales bacterium]|nr:MAG: hypothetical protein EAZ64_06995 [Sphingobacteriales bacterium]
MGEEAYMDDVVDDLNRDITCMYHCFSSSKTFDESITDLSTMFQLTEKEILEILEITDNIKKPKFEETASLKYLKGLSTKELNGLYKVLSTQNLGGESLEIRKEIELIVEKRVLENENFAVVGEEIMNFNIYSEIENWQNFELKFETKLSEKHMVIDIIKSEIPNFVKLNGIYSIFDKTECLYIGVGRPIWSRIKSHYTASQKEDKAKRWSDFFSQYKRTLTVYWIQFDNIENKIIGDKARILVESILQEKYKPKFEQ